MPGHKLALSKDGQTNIGITVFALRALREKYPQEVVGPWTLQDTLGMTRASSRNYDTWVPARVLWYYVISGTLAHEVLQ